MSNEKYAVSLQDRRLKIGLIVPGFSSDESDWCIPALLDTVRVLSQRHEVHLFTLRYPHRRDLYTVFGAAVYALGGATAGGLRRISLLARAVRLVLSKGMRHTASQHLSQRKFDVLHALWADEPGFVAVTAGRLLGVPTVVSLLGGELVSMPEISYGHQLSRAARWMVEHSLRRASTVTVGSQTLAERVKILPRGETACDRHPLIAPLGVDTSLFSPGESRIQLEGGFRLLHIASLEPVKNQPLLLHTVDRVRHALSDIHLHIVGDGTLRPELQALAQSLQLERHVTFHGSISHEKLPDYYRAADLCILTSFYESQSMVALEAGACGKATIGTRVGILPELIPETYLNPVGEGLQLSSTHALANSIVRLAQDESRRLELNRQVYQQVQARYTLEQTVRRWEQIYQELGTITG